MNLDALKEIIDNQIEVIEMSARDNNANESTVVGIAKFVAANSYEQLTNPQKHHFDNCIKHLIEDVQCSGYTPEFEDEPRDCTNILDDDDLVEHYKYGKLCESCEAQASVDAHSRESFMRD